MPTDSFVDLEFKGKLVNVRKSQIPDAAESLEYRVTQYLKNEHGIAASSYWDKVENITFTEIPFVQVAPKERYVAGSRESPESPIRFPYVVRDADRFGLCIAACTCEEEALKIAAALNKVGGE